MAIFKRPLNYDLAAYDVMQMPDASNGGILPARVEEQERMRSNT